MVGTSLYQHFTLGIEQEHAECPVQEQAIGTSHPVTVPLARPPRHLILFIDQDAVLVQRQLLTLLRPLNILCGDFRAQVPHLRHNPVTGALRHESRTHPTHRR